ncbi:MAG: helix-turn-helix transcriptional regulator [Actinomycetia bacterium]|nr:helix-turn-helix transcriptional regulator [Actinomycetes bacterium]
MRTEWLRQHETGDTTPMALAERVKQLRTEHHWSQGDLAERINADAAQISRYENGRITPSADALVRLAETFGVSCDYLLVDNAPRRPFTSPEDALGHQLHDIAELDPDDLELVTRFIDALVTKTRLRNLTANIS